MINNNNTAVQIQFDVTKVVSGSAEVAVAIGGLSGTVKSVSASIAEDLKPIEEILSELIDNIANLTDALTSATEAFTDLLTLLQEQQVTEQWGDDISTTTGALSLLFSVLTTEFEGFGTIIGAIATKLQISAGWVGLLIAVMLLQLVLFIANVKMTIENWDVLSKFALGVCKLLEGAFMNVDSFLQNVFAVDFTTLFGSFGHVLNAFCANVQNVWNSIKLIFNGAIAFIRGVFTGNWKQALTGVVEAVTGIFAGIASIILAPLNEVIGYFKFFLSTISNGVQWVLDLLGSVSHAPSHSITVGAGATVGRLGTKFSTTTISSIPHLAQGAVLPANKPFLAVVGDQKHGTNVEAPLETIQEAVAVVMNDQVAAMMAGFEAVVRAINDKNATLELDGREIWNSYNAYNRKAAVIRGGMV